MKHPATSPCMPMRIFLAATGETMYFPLLIPVAYPLDSKYFLSLGMENRSLNLSPSVSTLWPPGRRPENDIFRSSYSRL